MKTVDAAAYCKLAEMRMDAVRQVNLAKQKVQELEAKLAYKEQELQYLREMAKAMVDGVV